MDNEKQEELKKLLVSADFNEATYETVSMQDLVILKNSAKNAKNVNKDEKAQLFFEKREEFFMHMVLRQLPKLETMYCVFCKATKLPYVTCDDETANDQVWIYSEERFAQNTAVIEKKEHNLDLFVVKVDNKQFLQFYTSLFMMGVNELVLDRNVNTLAFELEKLVRKPDYSEVPEVQRPIINAELMLTAVYFAQKRSLPEDQVDMEELRDLEEELLVNMRRGKILVPVILPEGLKEGEKPDLKDLRIPYVKLPNGDVYQAICSDATEFMKFNREGKLRNIVVSGDNLGKMCGSQVKGMMLNPATIGIGIPKEKL